MLQKKPNHFEIDLPIKGISNIESNNPKYAKNIENIIIGENNVLSLRNGTKLINSPSQLLDKEFHRTLSIMEYVTRNGNNQILCYLTYLQEIDTTKDGDDNILSINKDRLEYSNNGDSTILSININGLTSKKKVYLNKCFIKGANVKIQSLIGDNNFLIYHGEITNVIYNSNNIIVNFDFLVDILNIQTISLERAGIYLAEADDGNQYFIEAKIVEDSCIELSKNLSSILYININLDDGSAMEIPVSNIGISPAVGQQPLIYNDGTKYRNVRFRLPKSVDLINKNIKDFSYINKVRNTDYIGYEVHENEILTGVFEEQINEINNNLTAGKKLSIVLADNTILDGNIKELKFIPDLDKPPFQYDDGTISRRVHFVLEHGLDTHDEVIQSLQYSTNIIFKDKIEYKIVDEVENYVTLVEDLDPAVFVSHVFLDNKLLICNGVDNNKIYDGISLQDHFYYYPMQSRGNIQLDIQPTAEYSKTIKLKILDIETSIIQQSLSINKNLIIGLGGLYDDLNDGLHCNVEGNIIIGEVEEVNGERIRNITINVDLGLKNDIRIKKLVYFKLVPPITICSIIHKRLFYVSSGRLYKNWSKQPETALTVFFGNAPNSLTALVNDSRLYIEFLNLSGNSKYPDELLKIAQINANTVFFCRNSIHIYQGDNPTTLDTEEGILLTNFKIKDVIEHTGIYHPNLVQEFPNYILFFSNFNSWYKLAIVNQTLNLTALPVVGHINKQLKNEINALINDNDYRMISSFYYAYGGLFGIKIKVNTFVFNIDYDAWVVFTENFAITNCFGVSLYTQNLYLGMPNGKLLLYCDKEPNINYEEYQNGMINWTIAYEWLDFNDTWANTYIGIRAISLKETSIKIRLYYDYNLGESESDEISIKQIGSIFNKNSKYDISEFTNSETNYCDVDFKFFADSILINLSGTTDDLLMLDKFYFVGKNNKGLLYGTSPDT